MPGFKIVKLTPLLASEKELGLDLEVTKKDFNQDKGLMGRVMREVKWTDYDYVFTNTTVPSKAAMEAIAGTVPQIFVMVAYPVEAGLVKSFEKSGKKITGASNFIGVGIQYDSVLKVKPLKNVGIMFNPTEENTDHARNDFEKESASRGIKTHFYRTGADIEHVKKVAQEVVNDYKAGKIDGLFLPPSSFYNTKAKEFGPILQEGGVFSFSPVDNVVKGGATMGVLYNRGKLGKLAAERLKELVDGKLKIEEAKILLDESPEIAFNKASVEKIGLKVPADAIYIK